MGCFQVRYDSRVVIYERKLFMRLATDVSSRGLFGWTSLKHTYSKLNSVLSLFISSV